MFAIFGVLCGAVLLAGAVVAVGLFLSAPARAKIGPPPADLRAEEVTIPSASGAALRGWFVEGRPGGGAVVLMHGVRDNRLSMLRRARLLGAAGFSVLLFDLQAHGESGGDRITFGHLEALDARAAVAFVRRRLPAERIGTIGVSLGGAAALLGPAPLPVDALVIEAVYPEIGSAVSNRIRSVLASVVGPAAGGLVARPLARLFELLLPPFVGVAPGDLRPIDRIAEVTAPVLVAAGTRDDRTTIAEAVEIFQRAPEPKLLWAVEGAGHVDLEAYAPDDYRRRVLPFLAERLRQIR
ncbi:MAG: alpha/beta fold hydrolase [Xanthobacteraceae bacterium]